MTSPEPPEAEQPEEQVITPADVGAVDEVLGASIGEGEEPPSTPDAVAPIRDADPGNEGAVPPEETPTPAAEAAAPLPGPFAVSGLQFHRIEGGSVAIRRHSSLDPNVTPILLAILDRDTWCSVVAAVSVTGDTALSFQWARAVHDGRVSE